MMRRLYTVLVALLAPAALLVVLVRGLRDRAYRGNLRERFGWGSWVGAPSLWLHAVSVGEVSAAAAVVRALQARHPRMPFVLTTATPTGRALALKLFGGEIDIRFLPYDTPASVRRFLSRITPRVAILMETEIWPNLLHECRVRRIPVVLASARLSARSVSRYRRAGTLFSDAVSRNTLIAAQSAEDAERFIAIGADDAHTHVVGNVKFDLELPQSVIEQGRELRRSFGARPVWVAGSTHAGEEEQLVAAHAELRKVIANALLVLVPRHPQRFESVAGMLVRARVRFARRSVALPPPELALPEGTELLLADTMGELTALYAAADAAFVGGSLVDVGGHNLLEPAALGVPVVTGPYTANSRQIARLMIQRGGAIEVSRAQELALVLGRILGEPALRERMGACAREFVQAHRGSVVRLLDLIDPLL